VFDPPKVKVDTGRDEPPEWNIAFVIVGVSWLITLLVLMFISPVLSEGVVATMAESAVRRDTMLALDLTLDTVFVALGAYWGIALSRVPIVATALLLGFGFVLVQTIEVSGLPGVIDTGFPLWYQLLGNVNDVVGALAAALVLHVTRAIDA
jgi:hypothetical protein